MDDAVVLRLVFRREHDESVVFLLQAASVAGGDVATSGRISMKVVPVLAAHLGHLGQGRTFGRVLYLCIRLERERGRNGSVARSCIAI